MDRANLSHAVAAEIRERITRGELAAGSRINEVHLAGELEISRTPLREALTRLSGEAFLEARPKLGFFVRPLSIDEASELYPIRAQLDPWALRLAGLPSPAALDRLTALNGELAKAREVGRAIELDDAWHLALLDHCPNRTLLDLIRQMMWRTRRYEFAYLSDPAHRSTSATEHAELLATLRRRDLAGACRWLTTNMSTALPALVRWLEARVNPPPRTGSGPRRRTVKHRSLP